MLTNNHVYSHVCVWADHEVTERPVNILRSCKYVTYPLLKHPLRACINLHTIDPIDIYVVYMIYGCTSHVFPYS